jgi:ABC-type Mn2+/Zn2+ transport system ATPase subunit
LAVLSDADQLYITPAISDLARLIRDLPAGSIGVSGPRGAGKTTLLRYFSYAAPPAASPADSLPLRVGLYFYDTVTDVFVSEFAATVRLLRAHDLTAPSWIDRLASAWSIMSANPALAQEMIDDYRKARGLKMSKTRLKPAMLARHLRL